MRTAKQRAAQRKASLASAKKRRRRGMTQAQRRAKSTARYEKKLSKKYTWTKTVTKEKTDIRGRRVGNRKDAGGYSMGTRTEYQLTRKPKKKRLAGLRRKVNGGK